MNERESTIVGPPLARAATFLRSVNFKTLLDSGGRATTNASGMWFFRLQRADVLWMGQLVYLQTLQWQISGEKDGWIVKASS